MIEPWMLLTLLSCALVAVGAYVHYRMLQLAELVATTNRDMVVYAEASIAVADRVRHLATAAASRDTAQVAAQWVSSAAADSGTTAGSRRLLLKEARSAMLAGVPVREIVAQYGLSGDEGRLLSALKHPELRQSV